MNPVNRLACLIVSLCVVLPVSASPLSRALGNPALTPQAIDPVLVHTGGGYWLNDADSLLSELIDTADSVRSLIAKSNEQLLLFPGDADPVIAQMKKTDGRYASAKGDLSFAAPTPFAGEWLFVADGDARLGGTFTYDPDDEQRIRLAVMTGGLTGADLESTVDANGVIEINLGLQRAIAWETWVFGVALKYQHILLHERRIELSEYEENDLFDRGRDTRDYDHGNISIGIAKSWGEWQFHSTIDNLIAREFKGPLGSNYALKPQWRVGLSKDTDWGRFSVNSDLTERNGFALVPDEQLHQVEWRKAMLPALDLSVAGQWVQKGKSADSLQLGLHYHLLEHFKLDASLQFAGIRELGMGLNVQFFFE